MRLGIDCGGTKTEAVVLDDKGNVIDHILVQQPSTRKTIYSIISVARSKHKIDFVGIGFPSAIDDGKVTIVNNLKEWNNTNIQKEIGKKTGIKCKVMNDAKCFALAEASLYENKKHNILVGITLGTGIGCGIVINGKILRGVSGAAGEINRTPYLGKTLEDFTSKKFFLRKFNKEPKRVFEDFCLKKSYAKKAVNEYAKNLGFALSVICLTVEPNCIVFGGSISKSFDLFVDVMKKELKKHIYPQTYEKLIIKSSRLKYSACIGAALLN